MDTLVHYESENPEFKNEAKNLLTNFLGFKPDLHASWKQELNIRIALERVREGTLTSEQLKKQVEIFGQLTKSKLKDLKTNHA